MKSLEDYRNQINDLKDSILKMIKYRDEKFQIDTSSMPSEIWREPLLVFDYLINLSENNFKHIRYHTSWTTGDPISRYWHQPQSKNPERIAELFGYVFYTENLPEKYWISEPPIPGIPLPGIKYKNVIINRDLCRYQSVISNLFFLGILEELHKKDKNIVVEIGSGYGALTHHLANIFGSKTTCIILDLPEMLLFSGGYLIVNNPDKKIYIYDEDTFNSDFLTAELHDYDFVLLPNYVLNELYAIKEVDLILNTESFQEMTTEQVKEYLEFAQSKLSGYLYSKNVDRHPMNKDKDIPVITTLLNNYLRLLPSLDFYDKHIKESRKPYYQKCYIGVNKNKKPFLPSNASMRLSSGEYEFIGNKYYLSFEENGKIAFRKKRSLVGNFISFGLFVAQKIFRFNF